MKITVPFFCAVIALIAITVSCSSNTPIPDDATAKELIQRGQEAFERNKTKEALRYFTAVVDRFGTDPARYVEAQYEIAHIYMKKKNYAEALPILEELTALFSYYPIGTFPPAYEKLAKLELQKIPEEKLADIHATMQKKAEKQERERIEAELKAQLQQTNLPAESETVTEEETPPAEDDDTLPEAETAAE